MIGESVFIKNSSHHAMLDITQAWGKAVLAKLLRCEKRRIVRRGRFPLQHRSWKRMPTITAMTQLPNDQHITYQRQYRKCGKASCSTCRDGQGHGPYWYAYWREGARLRSGYVGKIHPHLPQLIAVTSESLEQSADIRIDTRIAEPIPA